MPAKKKVIRKASSKKREAPVRSGSISVTFRRARNGYVVSTYSERINKDITYIAKTKQEAKSYVDKLLAGK